MKNRLLTLFLFLFFSPLLLLAQPGSPQFKKMAINASASWTDVDYVGDRQVGHLLDIHLPLVKKESYPVIICIYGSAWFSNSAKSATFQTGIGQHLLKNGFAVVSVNHRSSRAAKFPAQIQDVKAAIRFIRVNAPSFSLDASFIGITGWSSGGHLSAFAGTTSRKKSFEKEGRKIDLEGNLGQHIDVGSHVDAVVDWYGPTDFLIMDECGSTLVHNDPHSPESTLVDGPIQENKPAVALANPITYVTEDNPPFLIFHGNDDPLVPHCQSEKLHAQLQQTGVESELVIIDKGKHGPGVMIEKYYQQMTGFFKKQFHRKKIMVNQSPISEPQLEFIFEATVTLDPPREVGKTKYGVRRIIGINGGTFEGPAMKGVVLPGGADWQTVREDGTADLVATYSLKTDDGVTIFIDNRGIRTAEPSVLERLARGEDVPPSEYYMRTYTNFEVDENSRYSWMNKSVVISTGMRKANSVILRFYKVL